MSRQALSLFRKNTVYFSQFCYASRTPQMQHTIAGLGPSPGSLLTQDPSEITHLARDAGWDTSYQQVSKGRFSGFARTNTKTGLVFTDQDMNQELVIRGSAPRGMFAAVIATSYFGPWLFQGQRLAASQLLTMSPGSDAILRSPKDMAITTVSIPSERLDRALRALNHRDLAGTFKEAKAQEFTQERLHATRSLIQETLAELGGDGDEARKQMRVSQLEERLIRTIASGLGGERVAERLTLARRNRTRYVRRTCEYVEEHLREGVQMESLARAAGVSLRTLEYAFREVLDLGLYEYIKKRRLNEARRDLLRGEKGTNSVTRVALDYGFTHLGLFAQSYRRQFGDLPSHTLHYAK